MFEQDTLVDVAKVQEQGKLADIAPEKLQAIENVQIPGLSVNSYSQEVDMLLASQEVTPKKTMQVRDGTAGQDVDKGLRANFWQDSVANFSIVFLGWLCSHLQEYFIRDFLPSTCQLGMITLSLIMAEYDNTETCYEFAKSDCADESGTTKDLGRDLVKFLVLGQRQLSLDGSVKRVGQQAYGLVNSADSAQLGESTRFSGSTLPVARDGASELRSGRFWRRRIPIAEIFDLICNSVYFPIESVHYGSWIGLVCRFTGNHRDFKNSGMIYLLSIAQCVVLAICAHPTEGLTIDEKCLEPRRNKDANFLVTAAFFTGSAQYYLLIELYFKVFEPWIQSGQVCDTWSWIYWCVIDLTYTGHDVIYKWLKVGYYYFPGPLILQF
ncbi:hypothetical protein RND71_007975 [Anisodus tanguticus]|uniref:Uncharacterized protein n=1 Tax=Anisodus tanguticus TaxID=243964 RepID=A0AAE1SPZ2_9SOLA|nr:hypothetical protein RND71_007975 [Anisodus tanguticus]